MAKKLKLTEDYEFEYDEEKDVDKIVGEDQDEAFIEAMKSLARQCKAEYELAWKNQKDKKDEAGVRLKLYNNQKRNKEDVGDTTLFTIHQTVLASLYVDRLNVEFGGKEEGDEEVAENLNAMAQDDYDEMGKDELDYFWDWDTLFFGRGLISQEEYIRDPKNNLYLPIPHLLDPITFVRDPRACSVNGDRTGQGAMRFGGYETKMTKMDIENDPNMFKDINFTLVNYDGEMQSLLRDATSARTEAQGTTDISIIDKENRLGANAEFTVTVWYTHNRQGKKCKVWLVNDRDMVIGYKELKHDYWTLNDRTLYPTSHDWDGTSIPDLTEDKQRARAVAANLGLKAMKGDIYPMYVYDSAKISNRKDLTFGFNKFIPIDDKKGTGIENAIVPLMKNRPNMNLLEFVYTTLDISAQKATATPDIQQGIQSEKNRPLGETNLIAGNVDTRYSLSAKLFGMSERRFWKQWYQLYKDNFEDKIDEKVLRLVGAFGAKWRPLMRKDIIAPKYDPDVKIESQVLSRAKQLEERQSLSSYFGLALQEPTSNRRYGLKKLGKLHGLKKDEIERLFPPTIDERIAEDQNDLLNKGKFVEVLAEDDHNVHLEVHSKANPTNACKAHIETHKKALSIKKTNPEFFPEDNVSTQFQNPGDKPISQLPNMQMQNNMGKPVQPSQTSSMRPL